MLAPRRAFDHAIDLKYGATPPWGPIYPMSAYQLEELNKYLHKMLAEGKIVHSKSPAGAPILFVPKPDGRLQLCVDYRQLNKLTILNKYPLPLITELRERVASATIFTKLDLKDGYHLIRIKKGDKWKTAFRTRYGHYEYKVMPFSLVNAPATFQAMINTILREFLDHEVVVYLYDILIHSKTMDEHEALVKQVLTRVEPHDLTVSLKTSVVHVDTVEFLGYIVGKSGVTMSETKVERILNWRAPRSVKDVQIFIGFANFYRRFIENFSKVCKPITTTLKTKGVKHLWFWGEEQDKAIEELKRRFTSAPILAHFYPNRKTVIETDASHFALGCILSQYLGKRLQPVAFHSQKLNDAERNYEIHNKELLAILEAFREWKHYLLGAEEPVTVYTDHQNLQYFLTTKVWNPQQIRWAQWLANFNFKMVYRPDSRDGKPDALSWRPEYRLKEGATHREQPILKPEHVEVSLCHRKDRIQVSLVVGKMRITNRLRIKRLQRNAIVLTKGYRMAARHDIYAWKDGSIPAQRQMLGDTGIAIGLPRGTYGTLAARSGMASKHGIAVGGGVIDADYTSEIKVTLRNHGETSYEYKAGDRIAQLIVEKIQTPYAMEIDNLEDTDRGTQGFGSTNIGPKWLIT